MKKFFVILFVLVLSVFSFSCSGDSAKVDADETTDNTDQTIDDVQETTDDNQTVEDIENTIDDSQTVSDNEVNDTAETQDDIVNDSDETVDETFEDYDLPETDGDVEITDEDVVHVEVECAEGLAGLSIKTFYNNGTENTTGGGTVTKNPAGTSTEDPELTCYDPNTVIALTVLPDTGFDFSQWKGKGASAVTGTFPNFSITLGTEKITLRAEFVPQ